MYVNFLVGIEMIATNKNQALFFLTSIYEFIVIVFYKISTIIIFFAQIIYCCDETILKYIKHRRLRTISMVTEGV